MKMLKILIMIIFILVWYIVLLTEEIGYYREFYSWVGDNHFEVFKEFFEPR